MEYKPEFDTFAFEEQCNDLLHALIFASLSSLPSPYHVAPPSVLSSSSLELKPLPNTFKYAFLGSNETFPVIIANDSNLDQEIQFLDLAKGKPRGSRVDLRRY